MSLYCKNCAERAIPVLEVLANSTSGAMRCRSCGKTFSVPRPLRTLLQVVEGTSVLVGAIYSVFLVTLWPLLIGLSIGALVRGVIAPKVARLTKDEAPL